ncbi:hypothetical protein E2C01_043494 [Portunus trituberculatus]|uniref:Uncharacterized protein n=1 Tax=Portunus trituberculatus TaxID=210409 RepID=A0A5B7FT44_PORTR|nr:hypothetical protein [Portunus trituberculatus]
MVRAARPRTAAATPWSFPRLSVTTPPSSKQEWNLWSS